jgi:membrane protease YdiL (CAAX protease family)
VLGVLLCGWLAPSAWAAAFLLAMTCLGAAQVALVGWPWQVLPGAAVAVLALSWLLSPRGRRRRPIRTWIPAWDSRTALLTIGSTVAASIFILSYLQHRGVFTFTVLPMYALVLLPLGNAVLEECIWRGALMKLLLDSRLGTGVAVAVQAVSFGLAHWSNGYPSGIVGAGTAAVFGVTQGLLAVRTRSLAVPILTHWIVDMVIFFSLFRA